MARVRSPNYPTIGLGAAVEKARTIHKGEGKNAVPREALAKLLGYGGLNGGSATMLSALGKYGLIESVKDGEARITDLAMRILHPDGGEEKLAALEEAAFKPAIFAEIREKWPERPPGDESLKSFLARKGFTEGALEQVIQFYREIIDMVPTVDSDQNHPSPPQAEKETPVSSPTMHQQVTPRVVAPPPGDVHLLSQGEPYRVSLTRGGIEVKAHLQDERSADELIQAIQAWKLLLRQMGPAKSLTEGAVDELD
jgi:hypothetical protein